MTVGSRSAPRTCSRDTCSPTSTDAAKRTAAKTVEGPHPRTQQGRQRRRARLLQGLAAQPVRHQDPRAQEGRHAGGLRPHRHRVPSLAARCTRDHWSSSERRFLPLHRPRLRLLQPPVPADRGGVADLVPGLEHVRYNADHGFTLQPMLLLAPLCPDDSEDGQSKLASWPVSSTSCLPGGCGTSAPSPTRRCSTRCSWSCVTSAGLTRMASRRRSTTSSPRRGRPLTATIACTSISRTAGICTDPGPDHRLCGDAVGQAVTLCRVRERGQEPLRGGTHLGRSPRTPHGRVQPPGRLRRVSQPHRRPAAAAQAFNASYSDLPYEDKLPHYNSQNLLARPLHPLCYAHNPGFLASRASGLPFRAHEEFKKADLDARGTLYRQIAERIWNPDQLLREVGQ